MTLVTKPACSRAAARIRKRFSRYQKLAWSIGFGGIWLFLFVFYAVLKGTAARLSGMYVYNLDGVTFDTSAVLTTWFILVAMVFAIIRIAIKIDALKCCLDELEQEQLQLVAMQDAYMRNAAISEPNDKVNSTYHSKIYGAVVCDLENIINK